MNSKNSPRAAPVFSTIGIYFPRGHVIQLIQLMGVALICMALICMRCMR